MNQKDRNNWTVTMAACLFALTGLNMFASIDLDVFIFMTCTSYLIIALLDRYSEYPEKIHESRTFVKYNMQIHDYIRTGIKCKIIETKQPCFIWNVDEKRIVEGNDCWHISKDNMFESKSGNIVTNIRSCSEMTPEFVDELNKHYAIAILCSQYEYEHTSDVCYRFAILD